jgi:iron complex outermembrane recepter protein
MMATRMFSKLALFGSTALMTATLAHAQDAAAPVAVVPQTSEEAEPDIVVVGSRIAGAKVTDALPVVVVGEEKLDSVAAVSGDELIRSIPQMGDVSFNTANNAQTSNAARGDVGSVNLRSLGVGNTLVLLNGRRVVAHPTSQGLSDTGLVPVISYNSNAIPTTGLARLEVLLDGAAALYGSDAVAGVVNTVVKSNYDGLRASAQYGGAEGTSLREFQGNLLVGKNFDRGNITVSFEYTQREALRADDQDFTATADLRPLFADYPAFATLTGPDTRATRGVWPALQTSLQVRQLTGVGTATRTLTTSAGAFHVRPLQVGGVNQTCSTTLAPGLCLVNTTLPTTGVFRDLRYDTASGTTVMPDVKRYNLFANGHYDLTDTITLFGEFGYYHSNTRRLQPPVINLNRIWIPASNYWNPFGATTLPNGQANPNRLPGLTNVPAAGLPVLMTNYRFVDAGPQTVDVTGNQLRALIGLKGDALGFDWETAFVYSEADARDSSFAVKSSALQQSLALATPDAYNPFNGGCLTAPTVGDCTPSSQTAIDAIGFQLERFSKTTLAMGDFRASRPDFFSLPGGDVGIAFGAEFRRETQRDNRDSALDGSNPFVDAVSGEVTVSDAAAVSDNPDTFGKRTVAAAYVELAVPLVSEEMNIPLVRSFNLQLAGRYEHYSDFGSVARPKVAAAWDVVDGVRLRGSFSQGFRAPNLEQTNAVEYGRLATTQDFIRCEADLRAGRIATFGACGQNVSYSRRISGNPDLEPEKSTNYSAGIVLEPKFLDTGNSRVTLTADYWSIRQSGIVGTFGNGAAIAEDYLLRLQGSSNPNVVRDPVNADDTAAFAGTGIAPAGRIIRVLDQFVNLQPQTVRGLDFGLYWTLDNTGIGDFDFSINASRLLEFERQPGPQVDALVAARAAGEINAATPLPEGQDLIEADGRPKWRGTASLTWKLGKFQLGGFARYIGKVNETGFVDATGNPWVVDDTLTFNLYGQVKIKARKGLGADIRWRIGVRNLTNEKPPLTSEGYLGSLYSPYGRYWYTSVNVEF